MDTYGAEHSPIPIFNLSLPMDKVCVSENRKKRHRRGLGDTSS
jgi:hypothetical protein